MITLLQESQGCSSHSAHAGGCRRSVRHAFQRGYFELEFAGSRIAKSGVNIPFGFTGKARGALLGIIKYECGGLIQRGGKATKLPIIGFAGMDAHRFCVFTATAHNNLIA